MAKLEAEPGHWLWGTVPQPGSCYTTSMEVAINHPTLCPTFLQIYSLLVVTKPFNLKKKRKALQENRLFWYSQQKMAPVQDRECRSKGSKISLLCFPSNRLCILIFKISFYWRRVCLQCYVSLYHTAKWSSYIHIYTHIYPLFKILFPYRSLYWAVFPVLHGRLLSILYTVVCICQFQSSHLSLPQSFPLGNYQISIEGG